MKGNQMKSIPCILLSCVLGCGSLVNLDKTVPNSAVISSCEICMVVPQCSQCCHACAAELCYDQCKYYPPDCAMCEENYYWDCMVWNCVERE